MKITGRESCALIMAVIRRGSEPQAPCASNAKWDVVGGVFLVCCAGIVPVRASCVIISLRGEVVELSVGGSNIRQN